MPLYLLEVKNPNFDHFTKEMMIFTKKNSNNIISQSKRGVRKKYCLLCKKEVEGHHNSHTIPQFVLKNISLNGYVLNNNSINKLETLKKKDGIKAAGTFHYICSDCDVKRFRTYENKESYNNITQETLLEILLEISLKNQLFKLHSDEVVSNICKNLYLYFLENQYFLYPTYNDFECNYLFRYSLFEYYKYKYDSYKTRKELEEINQASINKENIYELFFHTKLSYTVPIAFQGSIGLFFDFNGNIINNILYSYENPKDEFLELAILPMENETHIFLFSLKNNVKNQKFYKHFNQLSFNDKLSVINYIVFLYTENFFINPNLYGLLNKSFHMQLITKNIIQIIYYNITKDRLYEKLHDLYNLNYHDCIPNLLLPKYQIKS